MRVWFNGRTSAFQADDAGSIPVTRSRDTSPRSFCGRGVCYDNRLYLASEVSNIKLLCLIPILRFIQKRLLACDSCKAVTQVSRADYKARLATQRARLLAGQFPASELARERAKLGRASTRRVVKLVASSIALLVTLSLALAMVAGLDLPSDGEVPAVMALVASAVAFALSLRHFLYARRANAAIDRVLGRA